MCFNYMALSYDGKYSYFWKDFFSILFFFSLLLFSLFPTARPDRRRPLTGAPVNQYDEPRGMRENLQHTVCVLCRVWLAYTVYLRIDITFWDEKKTILWVDNFSSSLFHSSCITQVERNRTDSLTTTLSTKT